MRKRKSKSSFCQVDHLELRQLLSATIYVSAAATGSTHDGASWATAFTDLQSGLTAAAGEASSSNPVIIEVGQGTYNPTSTTGPRTATFQLIDDVSIQGGYAGAGQANPDAHNVTEYPTILSGDIGAPGVNTDNSYTVVTASGTDNTAALDGFTITAGNSYGSGYGGIFDNAGNPIISNCTITGNTGGNGGGMHNQDASPTLTNCIISGNTGNGGNGGGMYNQDASPTLTNCIISGNTATGLGAGIMDNNYSSPTLVDCTISGNTGVQKGGGMYNKNHSSPILTNCTINGNAGGDDGGGMENIGFSSPILTGCTISGNTAIVGGGIIITGNESASTLMIDCIIIGNTATEDGGGIENSGSTASLTLVNCTLIGNTAGGDGGGMENNAGASLTLTNCTLTGNTAGTTGGGIQNYASSTATLVNSIVYGDTAASSGNEIDNIGGTTTITYSDIAAGGIAGPATTDASDISDNPMFFSGSNLRLEAGSPAIGAGNVNAGGLTGVLTDIDGLSRIVNGSVDMGAYQSHYALQSTLYVDASATGLGTGGDWTDAYPSLAAALDYAVSGETIYVAQGTYYPTLTTDRTATFQLESGVALHGGYAGDTTSNPGNRNISAFATILSGDIGALGVDTDNSYHVVTASGTDNTAMLDGFTITAGDANGSGANATGAGIQDVAGSPTLSNCTITGNTAGENGGGIFDADHSSPSLSYSTLSGNTAGGNGGGMYDTDYSSPTLGNTTLSGNIADGSGGGMFNNHYSSPTLTICTLTGNFAGTSGGGMFNNNNSSPALTSSTLTDNAVNHNGGGMDNGNNSSPALSDCILSGNTAKENGGGMSNYDNSSPALSGCTLSGNTATGTSGGAMANYDSSPTLTNCTISGNTATNDGGGMYNQDASPVLINDALVGNSAGGYGGGLADNNNSSLTLTNCTLTGNSARSNGGAIYNFSSSALAVTNSIFWGDTVNSAGNEIASDSTGADTVTVTYSDIDGGYAGAGNIDSDPHFIRNVGTNGPTDYGDLELQGASLAINAGSNAAVPMGVTTDLAGNPRISDGTVDLGAYETQAHLAITAQPTGSVTAGSVFSMTIQVEDPNGDVITNDNSNFTVDLGASPVGAALGGTLNATAVDGVAGFSGLSLTEAGTYSLASSNGNLPVTTSNSFTITAAAPAALVITQQPGNSTAGQDIPAIQVEVEDQYGNLADGSSVNVALSGSTGASLGGTTELATSGGVASFSDLVLTQAGSYTLSITDGDLPGLTSSSFTIDPAAAAKLAFTLEPANTTAGQTMANFAVEVQDQYGNLITGDTSTVTIASTPAGISTSIAATDGIATFTGLSTDTAGTFTLSASDGSLAGATSSSFTIAPGAAVTLVITQQPANTLAGQNIPIQVEVEDQYGNPVDGTSVDVAISGSTGASLGGTTELATSGGVASFANLAITQVGTYTLSITDGDLPGLTSSSFTIDPAAAAKLAFVLEPADTNAGQTMANFAVEVQDQYGNLITSDTSTVAIASTPAGISTSIAAVDGIAIFVGVTPDTAGTFTLSASDGSLAGATSSSFTISPAAAAKLVVTQQPGNGVAGQTMANFAIEVQDQYGNLITSNTSTVAIASTPAGIATRVAAVDGIAIFTGLSTDTAGTYTLSASDGSLAGATSSSFTITAGAAATLVITQQPASTLAGQNIPVQVEVEDQYGNAVNGASVTLALAGSAPSGAILAGTLTEPTAGGIAAFSDLSLNRAGTFTLSASDGNLPAVTTQSFAIAYAGPQLVFASEPASAVAGGKLPAFTIDTDDTAGNIVTGGKSKITLTLSSGGKIYGSAKATVNKKTGMATFKNISLHTAGTYTLTAADSSYASGISTEFTITAGAAKKLAFNPQPANAAANTPFNVSVELLDKYGNAVNDGSTVDLVLGAHPKTAVSLNSSAAVSDGFADFDDVTLDTAGPYTLVASDGKLKATSKKFEVA